MFSFARAANLAIREFSICYLWRVKLLRGSRANAFKRELRLQQVICARISCRARSCDRQSKADRVAQPSRCVYKRGVSELIGERHFRSAKQASIGQRKAFQAREHHKSPPCLRPFNSPVAAEIRRVLLPMLGALRSSGANCASKGFSERVLAKQTRGRRAWSDWIRATLFSRHLINRVRERETACIRPL